MKKSTPMNLSFSLIVISLIWVLSGMVQNASGQTEVEIGREKGEMYPDFYLNRLSGEGERLSSFRGKKTLLIQFASW